jgi:serine/threonine protein kinase
MTASSPDAFGRQFGGYEILRCLGRRGGARVYQARQLTLDRTVRLVVLPAHEANKPARLLQFEREVAVVSELRHEHLLSAIDAGELDGHLYVVTEDIAGNTLADAFLAGRTFDASSALRIAHEIALALDHFEAAGFVHRYVTPSAIVLVEAGIAKLAGLSRVRRTRRLRGEETWFDQESDEAFYSPPERWRAGSTSDVRGDVYALGCVLHQLLCGRPPFRGSTAAVMDAHVKREPRSMRYRRPDIPIAAEHIVMNCLQKSRADRYQHAAELVRDLAAARAGEAVALL